jgi:hypothetical protein
VAQFIGALSALAVASILFPTKRAIDSTAEENGAPGALPQSCPSRPGI